MEFQQQFFAELGGVLLERLSGRGELREHLIMEWYGIYRWLCTTLGLCYITAFHFLRSDFDNGESFTYLLVPTQ